MKLKKCFMILFMSSLGLAQEMASKQEIGLTLGGVLGSSLLGSGVAFQANYAHSLVRRHHAALYGEVHFLANPLRDVNSSEASLTHDVASLYVTPGVRLKLLPERAVSPYVVAGGGYALYEQSRERLDGQPNPAPRLTNRGAFDFGGGVDFKLWRFIGWRAEVRDFYTGSPAFNTAAIGGGRHNAVASAGFVLRFE